MEEYTKNRKKIHIHRFSPDFFNRKMEISFNRLFLHSPIFQFIWEDSYLRKASTLGTDPFDTPSGSNLLVKKASMIVSLVFSPVVKAPRQSILASLLSLARCAAYTLSQRAAYAPLTLFTEIETPNPVPQTISDYFFFYRLRIRIAANHDLHVLSSL